MGRPPTSRSRKNPMAAAAWEAAWKVQCPIPRDCPSCEKCPWKMPKNGWHSPTPKRDSFKRKIVFQSNQHSFKGYIIIGFRKSKSYGMIMNHEGKGIKQKCFRQKKNGSNNKGGGVNYVCRIAKRSWSVNPCHESPEKAPTTNVLHLVFTRKRTWLRWKFQHRPPIHQIRTIPSKNKCLIR